MSEQFLQEGKVAPPGISAKATPVAADGKTKAEIQPKANIKILQQDTFHQFIATADKPVIVDFWAMWCSPCTRMIPILEEIAAERDDIYVAKVNVDACKPLAAEYSIMVVPTMIIFKDGEPVASNTGGMSKEDILTGIAPFL